MNGMHLKKIFFLPFVVLLFINIQKTEAQTDSTIYFQKKAEDLHNHIITDTLAWYRKQIDSLDKQLIEILGKRMQVVEQVGYYKAKHNMPALQQNRFDAILQKNIALGKMNGLSEAFITELMNAIHKESLGKENAITTPVSASKP